MPFSKDRAHVLVKKCLPQICGNDSSASQPVDENLTVQVKPMCRLWSGMGHVYRVQVFLTSNSKTSSKEQKELVIKHVAPPPRGRQSFGDRRKAESYQVEANFYDRLAAQLIQQHKVNLPQPFLVEHGPGVGEIAICMSHLKGRPVEEANSLDDQKQVLSWLARFHAVYWGQNQIDSIVEDAGLQKVGCYWHLDTRPEEHGNMSRKGWEGRLWRAAKALDACLKRDSMQCLIHGDAKEANMILVGEGRSGGGGAQTEVAMYDFQYCGKGPPTRDIAYFLCSSCSEEQEVELVEYYHEQLVQHLESAGCSMDDMPSLQHLKDSLELALCDFCRFMCGWGFWGFNVQDRVKRFLDRIDGGKDLGSEEAYDKAIRKVLW